jgi:hypothetical protein
MNRISAAAALVAVALWSPPALAASPAATKVIESSRSFCSGEKGKFTMAPGAISAIDLTGDGKPDEIVDASKFNCSTAASLYCGNGGCPITAIVAGKPTEFFAQGWRTVDWAGSNVLLLGVHGSRCGALGTTRCVEAVTWSEGSFRTVAPAN